MPGGLTVITQDDFSGGMFEAPAVERIPTNGSYDIQNGLLDADEGVIYRRGGAAYLSPAVTGPLVRVWDARLAAGTRTMAATAGGMSTSADFFTSSTPWGIIPDQKPAIGNGIAWFPVDGYVYGWAGVQNTTSYNTGTVSVTLGSNILTGVGTTFSTNVYAGDIAMIGSPYAGVAAIQSVDSNTQLTLSAPWSSASVSGVTYITTGLPDVQVKNLTSQTGATFATVAAGRLVIGRGSQIVFVGLADIPTLRNGQTTNFHQIPDGAQLLGLESVRGTVIAFTDNGMFTISNIGLDLTDASGNPQQRLDRLPFDLVPLNGNGIGGYKGALVVPATDNVYLVDGVSAPVAVGDPIRSLYQSYVRAGYTTGPAQVFQNHYVLPIVNGSTWVTTLVCRLDRGTWSRMSGNSGSCVAFAQRVGSGARLPVLLGVGGTRLFDCTGWFAPTAANKNEPDGSTHTFSVTTRDYTLGSLKGLVKKARVWLEGVDAGSDNPTVSLSGAKGVAGSTFTALTLTNGTGGASTGDSPAGTWLANIGGKHARLKITSSSPWASLKIKAVDLFVRPGGRS